MVRVVRVVLWKCLLFARHHQCSRQSHALRIYHCQLDYWFWSSVHAVDWNTNENMFMRPWIGHRKMRLSLAWAHSKSIVVILACILQQTHTHTMANSYFSQFRMNCQRVQCNVNVFTLWIIQCVCIDWNSFLCGISVAMVMCISDNIAFSPCISMLLLSFDAKMEAATHNDNVREGKRWLCNQYNIFYRED